MGIYPFFPKKESTQTMTKFGIYNHTVTEKRLICSPTTSTPHVKFLKQIPARALSPTADRKGFRKPITEEGE